MPDNPLWIICLKCGSSFDAAFLERKGQYACPLCAEPGLRVMKDGEATDEGWPDPKDAA